jgi:hypothetical protein
MDFPKERSARFNGGPYLTAEGFYETNIALCRCLIIPPGVSEVSE